MHEPAARARRESPLSRAAVPPVLHLTAAPCIAHAIAAASAAQVQGEGGGASADDALPTEQPVELGSSWETLQRVSEGIGGTGEGTPSARGDGGGLRQASARWQRWLNEEIEAAARAGLPPPMTVGGAAVRAPRAAVSSSGGGGAGWILPPSLLPGQQSDWSYPDTRRATAAPPAQPQPQPQRQQHPRARPDGRPEPALAGEVVVVRGSGSPLGRQAALSSAVRTRPIPTTHPPSSDISDLSLTSL